MHSYQTILNSSLQPIVDSPLLAQLLHNAFPRVTSLTVYVRDPQTLHLLLFYCWPELYNVLLVIWHQRPPGLQLGSDFAALFSRCRSLTLLDLSSFYHWSEDFPSVLGTNIVVVVSLRRLNLLTTSFIEGFKSNQIESITSSCPNLEHLLVAYTFDLIYIGFVGDEMMLFIASNFPKLSLLHRPDTSSFSNHREEECG